MDHDLPPNYSSELAAESKAECAERRSPWTTYKLLGIAVSAVTTLAILSWCFQSATSLVEQTASNDRGAASATSDDADPSRNQLVRTMRERAQELDRDLLRQRWERRRRIQPATRGDSQQVYRNWRGRIDYLEGQLRGFGKVTPGSVGWDVRMRLEELRGDAPLTQSQQRQLPDQ